MIASLVDMQRDAEGAVRTWQTFSTNQDLGFGRDILRLVHSRGTSQET